MSRGSSIYSTINSMMNQVNDALAQVAQGGGGGNYVSKSGDSMTGNLTLENSALIFANSSPSSITISQPNEYNSYSMVLPSALPSNDGACMVSDSDGNLSFVDPSTLNFANGAVINFGSSEGAILLGTDNYQGTILLGNQSYPGPITVAGVLHMKYLPIFAIPGGDLLENHRPSRRCTRASRRQRSLWSPNPG